MEAHSEEEIARLFALMGLATPDDRKRFEEFRSWERKSESEPTFFIRASDSSKVTEEAKDA